MTSISYKFFLWRTSIVLSVAILTMAFIAAISGILISFNYQPMAGGAYDSLHTIVADLNSGSLILGLHNWAGNAIIVTALIQVFVMFFGRQPRKSWFLAWVSGFALAASAIALGWTAMILHWNQLGFWRLKVELSTLETIPVIGNLIDLVLVGGGGINTTTLTHFFTIHSYVLPVAAIAFAVVHLVSLMTHEQQERNLVLQQLERLAENQPSEDSEATPDKMSVTAR